MPPEQQNGPGFHYIIQWSRQVFLHDLDTMPTDLELSIHGESSVQTHTVYGPGVGQFSVQNQPTFQPYNISVQAANDEGFAVSPYQKVIGYSAEDGKRFTACALIIHNPTKAQILPERYRCITLEAAARHISRCFLRAVSGFGQCKVSEVLRKMICRQFYLIKAKQHFVGAACRFLH